MLCINSRNLTLRKLISRSCPSPAEFLEKNYIIRLGVIVLRLQFYKIALLDLQIEKLLIRFTNNQITPSTKSNLYEKKYTT